MPKASYASEALTPCPNGCRDKFLPARLIPRHVKNNCPTEECDHCHKKFSKKQIKAHETICAKKGVDGKFRCKRCDRPFDLHKSLLRHERENHRD